MSPRSAPPKRLVQPPAWLRTIIQNCLPADDSLAIAEELDALYVSRLATIGRIRTNLWYARQTCGFMLRLGPRSALGSVDSMFNDMRMALRFLSRRPGYVAAFVLTLGIGAGVLSTAYTAANWVLLRPVPGVREAGELITLRLGSVAAPPHVSFEVSHPDLLSLREGLRTLGTLAATTRMDVDVRAGNAQPSRLSGELVTANYFSVLHTRLVAGRAFVASEESGTSGVNVVVVSHAMARQWSSNPMSIVGSDVRVNGHRFQVVGVTEPEFHGAELPGQTQLWFPLSALMVLDPAADRQAATNRGTGLWRRMIGRMETSTSTEATVQAANALMQNVRKEYMGSAHSFLADHFTFQAFEGVGLNPTVRASVQRTLSLVGLAGAFLMLLAIANLANLTLTQATAREGAMAVRVALGASKARLARSLLAETVVLGLAGAGVALLFSALWSRWFEGASLAERGGSLSGMRMDARVVFATMAVALAAAVIASLRQTLASRTRSVEQLLHSASARVPARSRAQMSLVAVQVALSLTLVVSAGLLSSTVNNLRRIDLGFVADRLQTFAVEPHLHGFERATLAQLGMQFEARLAQDPGVIASGLVSPSPLASGFITSALYGSSAPDAKPVIGAGFFVSPGFLRTLGVTVLAGEQDWRGDSATIVISRRTLEQLYPGVSPELAIGRLVPSRPAGKQLLRIATVIADVQLSNITDAPAPVMFRPLSERHRGMSVSGFVRTAGEPARSIQTIHRAFQSIAPEVPVFETLSARSVIDKQFAERRIMALAASTLGVLGVVLAAVGLYGVLASLVAARQREIGIRMALGATPHHVRMRVLSSGLAPTLAGLLGGIGGALLMSALLRSQLYGLGEYDAATYAIGIAGLLVVSVVTCLVPAWRATRVAPATVMRAD